MDPTRFDRLARAVGAPSSRRGALRLLGGSALGGLLAALGRGETAANHDGCRHPGAPCKKSGQCCSRRCSSRGGCLCATATQCPQPANPCKEAVCKKTGRCAIRNEATGAQCDDGETCTANGVCDDKGACASGLLTDEGNCGACGTGCTTVGPSTRCPNGGCETVSGPLCFSEAGQSCECRNGNCCVVGVSGSTRACSVSPAGFACNEATNCKGAPDGPILVPCEDGTCP